MSARMTMPMMLMIRVVRRQIQDDADDDDGCHDAVLAQGTTFEDDDDDDDDDGDDGDDDDDTSSTSETGEDAD